MMQAHPFSKLGDRLSDHAPQGEKPIDLTRRLGRWRNTFSQTQGIVEFTLEASDKGYLLRALGAGVEAPWDPMPAIPLASTVEGGEGVAFHIRYDVGFAEMFLAANMNKGLIIIAAYTFFKDDSGRADYFMREFFYHVH